MANGFCKTCGVQTTDTMKYCPNCGSPLKEQEGTAQFPAVPPVMTHPPGIPTKMGKLAPTDNTLTMLAEYCTKTCATVGGDGYTEWVLNRRTDGSLQVDYYRNYMGYTDEIHETYPAPDDTWDRILAIKEKYDLKNPPFNINMGTCGGYSLIKISDGDKAIRITSGMLTREQSEAFSLVQGILVGIASK